MNYCFLQLNYFTYHFSWPFFITQWCNFNLYKESKLQLHVSCNLKVISLKYFLRFSGHPLSGGASGRLRLGPGRRCRNRRTKHHHLQRRWVVKKMIYFYSPFCQYKRNIIKLTQKRVNFNDTVILVHSVKDFKCCFKWFQS